MSHTLQLLAKKLPCRANGCKIFIKPISYFCFSCDGYTIVFKSSWHFVLARDWKVSEGILLQNWKVSELQSVKIGKCQDWKVSELESIRIGGGLESVRIQFLPILEETGKCQNWKVSESESVRIGKCWYRGSYSTSGEFITRIGQRKPTTGEFVHYPLYWASRLDRSRHSLSFPPSQLEGPLSRRESLFGKPYQGITSHPPTSGKDN